MNEEFLNKVCDQIVSETRIDDKVYFPFIPAYTFSHSLFPTTSSLFSRFSSFLLRFSSHCKDVYSLNKEETKYVWDKYKEEVTALMDKKELTHQEKG